MAPNLDHWLGKHHTIRDSIIWEYPTPLPASFSLQRAQPYKNWPQRDKGALQTAFDAAWNLGSIEVDDLPANILHPGDDSGPATALSLSDHIGRGSIAYVDAGHVSYSSHLRELFSTDGL
jgi:hypothetical protein